MNGKQLKHREPTMQKSPTQIRQFNARRYAVGKGMGLFLLALVLIFAASDNSGRLISSEKPLIDSYPGQFAVYFFAGFAGICGLDLIRKS